MENAKRISYRLRNGLVVEIEPDMSLPLVTIERTVMAYFGFDEELLLEEGIAIWRDGETGKRMFFTVRDKEYSRDELIKLAQTYQCPPIDLFNNDSFAQRLIGELRLAVTPVIFRNGSLLGKWRVERISNYKPFDRAINGIITGVNQPVSCENENLLLAVYATACRVIGLAKQAFIHFPNGAEGEAEIIACDFEFTWMVAEAIDKTLFRAEELDQYITSFLPDDVKAEAIATARAKCRAAIAQQKEEVIDEKAAKHSNEAILADISK